MELTNVMPEGDLWDHVDRDDALEEMYWAILKKDDKRRSGEWACREATILVLQLCRCSLSQLTPYLEDLGPEGFTEHGFQEVLIADHSGLDAYGDVELFGLFPKTLWGYHERVYRGKPYG